MYVEEYYFLADIIGSFTVFRGVAEGPVLSKLKKFVLEDCSVQAYTDFVAELYNNHGVDLSRYLAKAICEDENIYVKLRAHNIPAPRVLEDCVDGEFKAFDLILSYTSKKLKEYTNYEGPLPDFETSKIDLRAVFERNLRNISKRGYGIYARFPMFRLEKGEIVPIKSPDPVTVDKLIGYERQREELIANTRALLAGKPAANVLLTGDAGTGKSTTVKAVVNLLAPEGLRLIELKKSELRFIPRVMETLRENPLKFILFIDDLSFNKNDDNFSALKAALEGSASVKADNTVIYATSNRRHLVKESFSDREGDDVHRNDTMQELVSLSDRFGLSILYTRPSRQAYLDIVHGLCEYHGVASSGDLDIAASAFALKKGGFTPRAAEQFVNSILSSPKEA